MPNTTTLFGLTPQEHAAAVLTSLGEAGPGKDIYGVYSTLLNRKLSGGYGKNLVSIASAPQQFVANAGKSAAQIADPNFGRKIYGSRYDQAYSDLNNPDKLRPIFDQLNGATSFRGQALLQNRQKNDVMLDPKGNFYYDYNPAVHQKGSKLLSSTGVNGVPQAATTAQQPTSPNIYNIYVSDDNQDTKNLVSNPNEFLTGYAKKLFNPLSALKGVFNSEDNYDLG